MQFLPEVGQSQLTYGPMSPFEHKLSTLNNRLSPMLPLHFNKQFLPKDLCELQYLNLAECRLFNRLQNSQACSYDVTKFQFCRKNRDIRILDGIKRWETLHIHNLQKGNKKLYLQGLTFKLDRLKQDYGKVPSTVSKQMQMMEIQNQIETIKWRINYIKKMV